MDFLFYSGFNNEKKFTGHQELVTTSIILALISPKNQKEVILDDSINNDHHANQS